MTKIKHREKEKKKTLGFLLDNLLPYAMTPMFAPYPDKDHLLRTRKKYINLLLN